MQQKKKKFTSASKLFLHKLVQYLKWIMKPTHEHPTNFKMQNSTIIVPLKYLLLPVVSGKLWKVALIWKISSVKQFNTIISYLQKYADMITSVIEAQ